MFDRRVQPGIRGVTRREEVSPHTRGTVEADIRGFFDHMEHSWIEKTPRERVDDGALPWPVGKWLKAGILDTDGTVIYPEAGSPQGIVSPVISNVYPHYVLDLWFEKVIGPGSRGKELLKHFRVHQPRIREQLFHQPAA